MLYHSIVLSLRTSLLSNIRYRKGSARNKHPLFPDFPKNKPTPKNWNLQGITDHMKGVQ